MDGSRVIVGREENGFTLEHESGDLAGVAQRLGEVPLPPYIKRTGDRNRERDRERYQTIFARRSGAVAAPTAGLHFDDRVVSALNDRGVEIVPVTLHVGPGTFAPVRVRDVRTHTMESELYEISLEAADSINRARRNGRRVVAVGTTVVRAVESAAVDDSVRPGRAWTDLFIFPGYGFRIVDALVTNFHLPGSSLLMLVCAFGGTEKVMVAYREAVRAKYRFYSYGDAMFIE